MESTRLIKRYVKELANDFRKDYQKKCKEHPELLPAGFLREVNKEERMCERGMITNREAVKSIMEIWEKLDDWIWKNEGNPAIKL